MQYNPQTALSMDEAHILETQVLPRAKQWVMNYPPSAPLFAHGLVTLRYWGVKCPELRQRMAAISQDGGGS